MAFVLTRRLAHGLFGFQRVAQIIGDLIGLAQFLAQQREERRGRQARVQAAVVEHVRVHARSRVPHVRVHGHLHALEALAGTGEDFNRSEPGRIEAEIVQLDEPDRTEFLRDLGLDEPGLNRVIRADGTVARVAGARPAGDIARFARGA